MRYVYFSRIMALLMMIVIIFAGCPIDLTLPESGKTIITPGEGTQYYAYLDENGNVSETDTGKTLHYVDNNKNAEGIFSVADKFGEDDRVTVFNSDMNTTFTFLFREGKNFPYKLNIYDSTTTYYGQIIKYNEQTCKYDIVFQQNGFEVMRNLVLNEQFLELSESDLRLRNITIAAGFIGSLAVSIGIEDLHFDRSLKLKFLPGIKKEISNIKMVSYAAAFIDVPVGLFISPAKGGIIFTSAASNVAAAEVIVPELEKKITKLKKEEERKKPIEIKTEDIYVNVLVNVIYHADGNEIKRAFNNGEEFHIGLNESVMLEFTIPGLNNEYLPSPVEMMECFDPVNKLLEVPYKLNEAYFENSFVLPSDKDVFHIKFKRSFEGYVQFGKVSFGITLPIENDISINGKNDGISFQSLDQDEPTLRKKMVVIKFCIYPNCEDDI